MDENGAKKQQETTKACSPMGHYEHSSLLIQSDLGLVLEWGVFLIFTEICSFIPLRDPVFNILLHVESYNYPPCYIIIF